MLETLSHIAEVVEASNAKEANLYLKKGWMLLGTFVRDAGENGVRDERMSYTFGWPRSAGDPVRPTFEELNPGLDVL